MFIFQPAVLQHLVSLEFLQLPLKPDLSTVFLNAVAHVQTCSSIKRVNNLSHLSPANYHQQWRRMSIAINKDIQKNKQTMWSRAAAVLGCSNCRELHRIIFSFYSLCLRFLQHVNPEGARNLLISWSIPALSHCFTNRLIIEADTWIHTFGSESWGWAICSSGSAYFLLTFHSLCSHFKMKMRDNMYLNI